MKRERIRQRGKDSLELIEEAVHLLRAAPLAHWTTYYLGTLPFVLAVLYFWADMSRSPFAGQHLLEAALVLACLFAWMKTCQAVFSRQVRGLVSDETPTLNPARLGRIFLTQAAVQPSGLFVLPLMLLPAIPFGWAFAFYQNVTALDDGETLDFRGLIRQSARQALLWPRQNHLLQLFLSGFGFFVWLNVVTVCFLLPGLVKMMFGLETVFTRSGLSMLNSTFFAACLGLAYLCLDPILKTTYALRCFYGDSQRSGADLKAELRHAAAGASSLTLLALALWFQGLAGPSAWAADGAAPDQTPAVGTPGASIPAAELDQAIRQVIRQPKYAWREPRQKLIEEGPGPRGFFGRLFDRIKPFLSRCFKVIGRWLEALFRRLFSRQPGASSGDAAYRWAVFLHLVLYGLIAATATGLCWFLYRVWKSRRAIPAAVASQPLEPMPDLADETLGADQLPEQSWLNLANQLAAKGELRLAVRALYLASLAQLAARNLIQLARFKSNREYERELGRRAHALPGLVAAFGENLSVFDRTWYGLHEINPEVVRQFGDNLERMRASGPPLPLAPGTA